MHPELVSFFARLEDYLEEQVFGVALAQYCLEKPAHVQQQEPVPMMVNALHHNGSAPRPLQLHNNTPYILSLLFRGPQQTNLHLNPSEKQRFWIEPGTYLMGVVSLGFRIKPLRTALVIEPSLSHSVTFYEMQQEPQTGVPQLNYQETYSHFQTQEDSDHSEARAQKLTPARIREAQKLLKKLELYNGPVDGIVGPLTRRALRRYQAKQGLPVTGQLDGATQKALKQMEMAQGW